MNGPFDFPRVAPELVARARAFPSAILSDAQGRRGTLDARVQALAPAMKVAGPAFTVELHAGDNLAFHAALAAARPGDVIVVDGKADTRSALFGELMVAQARAAGLAGFVVDGPARDTALLGAGDFPAFATARNPCGPTKRLPGVLAGPVSVGGVAVQPGDLVVGDGDGVTVVPRELVAAVLESAAERVRVERARLAEIAGGTLVPDWLAEALSDAGMPPLG
jgi:4-hydroxy-4-methyl-2-oxoglutarate aldolase